MHERTRGALMGGRSDTAALVIASAVSLGLAALVLVETAYVGLAIVVLVLPIGATVLVLRVILGPTRLNRELERLASLPFEIDRDNYLAILAEDRASIALDMTVTFANAPPESAQVAIDTMGRAAKLRDARWIDHATLRLSAPDITTRFSSGSATQPSYVSTVEVHRWFSRSAIPLLCALHTSSPITRVAFGV